MIVDRADFYESYIIGRMDHKWENQAHRNAATNDLLNRNGIENC